MSSSICGVSWTLVVIILIATPIKTFGSALEPTSVWPLTNVTRGYDVILDTETAEACPDVYGSDAYCLEPGSSCSGGQSYVDIEMTLNFEKKFIIMADFEFSGDITGTLISFKDNTDEIWFVLSVINGKAFMRAPDEIETKDDKSFIPTDRQVALLKGDGKIKLKVEGRDFFEVHFPNEERYKQTVNGTLRLGTSFDPSEPDAVSGAVSCVRFYCPTDALKVEYAEDCTDTATLPATETDKPSHGSTWRYTGPYVCMESPCENGGRCEDDKEDPNTYRCHCVPGYTDQNCTTDIDDCVGHGCLNEGVCVDEVNSYSCDCTSRFNGTFCQTALPKTGNDMYSRVEDQKPDNSTAFEHSVVTSDMECGVHCSKTERCLSFSVTNTGPGAMLCTLFNTTRQETLPAPRTRYYKL